jgi:hypothetical protein
MIVALLFLAIFVGMVYLLIRLLQITPIYTGKAQNFAYKVGDYARRGADAAVKPIIFLDSVGASIKALFGRK